ncbi:MAG: divergent polysaccharide deacetylase family protein [Rhodospirillaceae bacterium]|jgi:polysaccharide deacetylase 2 family uncharacterized protein YibQ
MAEKDEDTELRKDQPEDQEEDLSDADIEDIGDLEVGGSSSEGGESDAAESSSDGESEEEDEELVGEEYDLDVDNIDFGDNFEDDDDDEEGGGLNKIVMIAAASVIGLAVLGGGGWFLFSGEDPVPDNSVGAGGVPRAGMLLPPKGKSTGMLAPPIGQAGVAAAGAVAGVGALKSVATQTAASGVIVPAVTMAAYSKLPELPPSQPVRSQVDPALTEITKTGVLPKISADGRKPWKEYARAFNGKDARPRIAIVVTGMGLSRAATEAAISRLPGPITLAFTPYAQALDDWASIARQSGHEVMLSLPMESATFPIEDPGPMALQSEAPLKENLRRLNMVLGQMGGYVGVISHMGSLLSKDVQKLRPILETLKTRGLMFVDNGATKKTIAPKLATSVGVPRAMVDVALDRVLSPSAIDAKLTQLERLARERAATVATTGPYPLVMKHLIRWSKTLEKKKIVLAPISALADVQFIQ